VRRWWGGRGPAAFAVALITAACAAPIPSPPVGSSSPTGAGTPQPTGSVAEAYAHWERIDLPDAAPGVYGGGLPSDVAAFGDGYLAVGTINASCCAGGDPSLNSGLIWTSKDGRTWAVDATIASFQHASLRLLLVAGSRLLVAGSYADPVPGGQGVAVPAIWTSRDGIAWTIVIGKLPDLVAQGGPGFIGFYRAELFFGPGQHPSFFMQSADGTTWTSASGPVAGWVQDLIATPDRGALAMGWMDGPPAADGGPTFDAMAWHTADGLTWLGPTKIATGAEAMSVVVGGPGYLAVGSKDQGPALWSSPDGLTWRQEAIGTLEGALARIFVVPGGFLIKSDAGVWFSRDGLAWGSRISPPPGDIATLISTSKGVLAVGSGGDSVPGHVLPAAWLASR
jgi:hypothetical protein